MVAEEKGKPVKNGSLKTSNGSHANDVVKKAVFITGCDTGFGHELAKRLDAAGFQVLAGCLNPSSEGATMLRDFCSASLRVLHLDVTREEHFRRASKTLAAELGPRGLWAVVANAGMMSAGELEWGSLDAARYLFEVNVFGVVNTVRTALPFSAPATGIQGRHCRQCSRTPHVSGPGLLLHVQARGDLPGRRSEARDAQVGHPGVHHRARSLQDQDGDARAHPVHGRPVLAGHASLGARGVRQDVLRAVPLPLPGLPVEALPRGPLRGRRQHGARREIAPAASVLLLRRRQGQVPVGPAPSALREHGGPPDVFHQPESRGPLHIRRLATGSRAHPVV
ncbi:hypothetical protein MRX96_021870 [Rhipicephalus microplus]